MKYPVPISIVMPVYNAERFIKQSIESIINQSFDNWELIVVDDASTDGTIEIMEEYNDYIVKIYRLHNNVGNYGARNFGITQANGKYIVMIDADDISLPERLRIQYNYLEKNRTVGAIGSSFDLIDENHNLIDRISRECNYDEFKVRLLQDNYMLQSTI